MGRLMDTRREESLEDIFFEIECLNCFSELSGKYKNTQLGFGFKETVGLLVNRLRRMIQKYNRDYKEKLDLTSLNGKEIKWK